MCPCLGETEVVTDKGVLGSGLARPLGLEAGTRMQHRTGRPARLQGPGGWEQPGSILRVPRPSIPCRGGNVPLKPSPVTHTVACATAGAQDPPHVLGLRDARDAGVPGSRESRLPGSPPLAQGPQRWPGRRHLGCVMRVAGRGAPRELPAPKAQALPGFSGPSCPRGLQRCSRLCRPLPTRNKQAPSARGRHVSREVALWPPGCRAFAMLCSIRGAGLTSPCACGRALAPSPAQDAVAPRPPTPRAPGGPFVDTAAP